jgi:hypothetical protein
VSHTTDQGAPSGASAHTITVVDALAFEFCSFTVPGRSYQMKLTLGTVRCSCPGYQSHGHCKHIRAAMCWLTSNAIAFAPKEADPFARFERYR